MEYIIEDEPMEETGYPTFNTPVHINITSYCNRRRDTDGTSAKAALDGIVALGILQDDGCEEIESITYRTVITKEKEKTIIEIMDRG